MSTINKLKLPTTTQVDLPQPFSNSSGTIQNIVEHLCGGVQIITSVKGTIRANHSHGDWHYLYVLSGSLHYFERPAGSKEKPEGIRFGVGSLVFTPPDVEHAVWFPEETVVLSISGGSRTHDSHEATLKRLKDSMVSEDYLKRHRQR